MIETENFVKIRSTGKQLSIISDHNSLEEIRKDFCFYVPGAHFTPQFRAKRWDGKKHFITGGLNVGYAPHGLMYDIVRWFRKKLYEIDYEDYRTPIPFKSINPTMGEIILRLYQLEAASACLQFGGGIIKLPTGSGKSAVITAVIRQAMAVHPDVLFVITVPRSSLVLQFYDEMVNEYGINKKYIGMWGGGKKTWESQPILITTRQSLCKQTKKEGRSKVEIIRDLTKRVMEYNVMMFVDECHQASCKSLRDIIDMTNPQWLFGFTGTMPREKVEQMEVKGILGNILYSKKTKELIKMGFLPPMDLQILKLKHDKKKFAKFMKDIEEQKIKDQVNEMIKSGKVLEDEADGEDEDEQKNEKYLAEIDYATSDEFRNNVIRKITEHHTKKDENVLILVERVAHGQFINDWIPGSVFLYGKDSAKVRYEVQKQCERETGKIIIATSGIFAMGVSIKRLHAVILAGISSAKVSLLQAIGRGLRQHKTKLCLKVYDIADTTQYSNRHLRLRLKVFDEEGFEYKVIEI